LRRCIDVMIGGVLFAILLFGVISVIYVGTRTRMLARIGRERSIIEVLQGAFSTGLDAFPGSRIGSAYVSATADADVGGDLYDAFRLDEKRGLLLVADVSGKGVEAAVNTAFVKYSIRMAACAYDDPARILSEFNNVFVRTIKEPNLFVTAFVGIVDMDAKTLRYASAGHATVYLRRLEKVHQLSETGPIIGIESNVIFGERALELVPADMLVLATDGLTEARDTHGRQIEDTGAMRFVGAASTDPQECADALVAAVREHSGGTLRDDLALLVLSFD
jgi:sigma-B regulation protein RsbU (phosphoserine phosphatase)